MAARPAQGQEPKPSASQPGGANWVEPPSELEIEVLALIAQGCTNQEIASKVYLSLNTGRGHMCSIQRKLAVNGCTQAIAEALGDSYTETGAKKRTGRRSAL